MIVATFLCQSLDALDHHENDLSQTGDGEGTAGKIRVCGVQSDADQGLPTNCVTGTTHNNKKLMLNF